jgi:hypothetical protein
MRYPVASFGWLSGAVRKRRREHSKASGIGVLAFDDRLHRVSGTETPVLASDGRARLDAQSLMLQVAARMCGDGSDRMPGEKGSR